MAFGEDLQGAVTKIFRDQWATRDGNVVPAPEDLGLGNDATNFDGTVLYADMADSTQLVDSQKAHFAAEIYKSYMTCASPASSRTMGALSQRTMETG